MKGSSNQLRDMAQATKQQDGGDVAAFKRMLEARPVSEFLRTLRKNIRNNNDAALSQIQAISETDKRKVLKQHSDDKVSLLQLAANYSRNDEVILRLAEEFPTLLLTQRSGDFEGQTVLHTIISKGRYAAVKGVLNILKRASPKSLPTLMATKAVGPRFVATVLMGELPLTVAALTFNMTMVRLLYEYDAEPEARNSEGDTVLHTLVRWAALYPDKLEDVERTIDELHKWLVEIYSEKTPNGSSDVRAVWFIENKRGQTALRLAACLALPSLVNFILNLDDVYRRLDKNDGVFDSLEYDVTEIDPVARRVWREKTAQRLTQKNMTPVRALGLPPASKQMWEDSVWSSIIPLVLSIRVRSSLDSFSGVVKWKRTASVLEIISETGDMKTAIGLMDNYLIQSIIRKKWFHYRKYYWIWLVLHILWMVLLSAYAIYRARLIPNPTSNVTITNPTDAHKNFVDGTAGLTIAGGICMLLTEVALYARSGQPFAFLSVHYNGVYRVCFLIQSLSLLIDGIWYFAGGADKNYLLILALLTGWWFLTFFMRPWDAISYYTVLLQKVLVGDMVRFCIIIFLELLSFSLCMYVIYIPADGANSDVFKGFDRTMLTMFKVMMGLTDLDILFEAPHPWLAIVLYISFVLLTSLLMLNSLIAMMSNTCSLVSENRVKQGQLQRLSVLLMLEGLLPRKLTWNSGTHRQVCYYDFPNEQKVKKERYFMKITSIPTHGSQQKDTNSETSGKGREWQTGREGQTGKEGQTGREGQTNKKTETMRSVGGQHLPDEDRGVSPEVTTISIKSP